MGKLPPTVGGETRNAVISSFRNWKRAQYVPNIVHPAIRWSKCDPLLESQVDSFALLTKLKNLNATVVLADLKLKYAANLEDKTEAALPIQARSSLNALNALPVAALARPGAVLAHPGADVAPPSQGTKHR